MGAFTKGILAAAIGVLAVGVALVIRADRRVSAECCGGSDNQNASGRDGSDDDRYNKEEFDRFGYDKAGRDRGGRSKSECETHMLAIIGLREAVVRDIKEGEFRRAMADIYTAADHCVMALLIRETGEYYNGGCCNFTFRIDKCESLGLLDSELISMLRVVAEQEGALKNPDYVTDSPTLCTCVIAMDKILERVKRDMGYQSSKTDGAKPIS